MNALRRFFMGRNGPDNLGLAALLAGMVFSFVPYGFILSMACLGYSIFRMVSKNIAARQKENLKFMSLVYKIKGWFKGLGARARDSKTHRVFKCPVCAQKLRVPKGKGKINIVCSKCGNKFVKKT